MLEGEVCLEEAESGQIGQTSMVRQPKDHLAEPKCGPGFRSGAGSATIRDEFGSHMGNVGYNLA